MKASLKFLALAALSFPGGPLSGQVLLSDSLISSYTIAELAAQGIGGAENAIACYRVVYATTDPFGQPTVASAAVALPVGSACTHALAAYMHGTILNREDVPSRLSGEIVVAYYLSASRYVAVLPDYLGLGDSPGPHPYMHAASEASAGLDALRAARELCAQKGVALNGQIFLTGYSQGGHACMATHRLIETEHADEFQVTAAAPCSGPYDPSGVQADVITAELPYPAPYYLPYVLFSYKHVYPWLYNAVGEVLIEPYATALPPLFLGNNGSGVVDDVMPSIPNDILVPAMLQAFTDEPEHPFRAALRANDVYDWAPAARTRLFYCDADDHVFYQNSLVARDAMQANGATDVQAINAGTGLDHSGCSFPALLTAKGVFDAMQEPCSGIGIPERGAAQWSLAPNPTEGDVRLQFNGEWLVAAGWTLHAADGRIVASGPLAAPTSAIQLGDLPDGCYVLSVGSAASAARLPLILARR